MDNLFRSGTLLEMLVAFGQVVNRFEIDFFLVGALARDIRLSGDPAFAPKRATKDVDIAIMLASEDQFYQVKDALLATGDFTAHVYFDLNTERIFQDFADVPDLKDIADRDYLQSISARVIGRMIGRLLVGSPELENRVLEILRAKSSGRYWAEMAMGIAEG